MTRVTVVNDNADFLELVGDILESDHFETTLIDGTRDDALERIRQSRPDVLMIDLRLGSEGLHGWEIARQVRNDTELSGTPILLCSADLVAMKEVEDQLDDRSIVLTLTKPFSVDALLARIDELAVASAS